MSRGRTAAQWRLAGRTSYAARNSMCSTGGWGETAKAAATTTRKKPRMQTPAAAANMSCCATALPLGLTPPLFQPGCAATASVPAHQQLAAVNPSQPPPSLSPTHSQSTTQGVSHPSPHTHLQEGVALAALGLPVLHWGATQSIIQLGGKVGRGGGLILQRRTKGGSSGWRSRLRGQRCPAELTEASTQAGGRGWR